MCPHSELVLQFLLYIYIYNKPFHHICFLTVTGLRKNSDVLNAELEWASKMPSSKWGKGRAPAVEQGDEFEECLTCWETSALEEYTRINNGGCFSLNQDPRVLPTMTTGKARLERKTQYIYIYTLHYTADS